MSTTTCLAEPNRASAPTGPVRRHLLGAVAAALALPWVPWAAPARAARSASSGQSVVPLTLAQEAPNDIDPQGWLVSEKYDGVRAWWDGHVLRFRSGLTVAAPASFLQALPAVPLDGELWLGRGRFDELSGIVRRIQPDEAVWRDVRYMVFELPGTEGRFDERARALRHLLGPDAPSNVRALARSGAHSVVDEGSVPANGSTGNPASGRPRVVAVEQAICADRAHLRALLDEVVAQGGEGLMLHRADAPQVHGRSPLLLKLKPLHDDEAVVIGHQPGQGRLASRLGALRVRDDAGRVFEVGTGLSDTQRSAPPAIGSRITFTHRGRTPRGVPRFAAFLREQAL